MISDILPGIPFEKGNQVSICITTNDISKAKQFYERLKVDGKVITALNEIFFSPAYGIVMDKFGVIFQIFTSRK